jgi:hypothetical protein
MSEKPTPDYSKLTTLDEVDAEIEVHKQKLVQKDVLEYRIRGDKKEYVAALNEQLKELKEEREFEMDTISALEAHKQVLANQGQAPIIPMPTRKIN